MGRRQRQRRRQGRIDPRLTGADAAASAGHEPLAAPTSDYPDADGNVLTLRGSLTPAARREYGDVLRGGLEREDAWQRATELLFERLAVAWTIAGVRTERQGELLARYRAANIAERSFVRDALRAHVAENFPELPAP
jgi:hypothetical protein